VENLIAIGKLATLLSSSTLLLGRELRIG